MPSWNLKQFVELLLFLTNFVDLCFCVYEHGVHVLHWFFYISRAALRNKCSGIFLFLIKMNEGDCSGLLIFIMRSLPRGFEMFIFSQSTSICHNFKWVFCDVYGVRTWEDYNARAESCLFFCMKCIESCLTAYRTSFLLSTLQLKLI